MGTGRVTLNDGRTLAYYEAGDRDGRLLFFFHGTPGSGAAVAAGNPLGQIPGVRVVAPDRPGYGLSDPKPSRTLLDWAADVATLADSLGVARSAVLGVSGGGPHALACAAQLQARVDRVLLVSTPAPASIPGATRQMSLGNRMGVLLGRHALWVIRRLMRGYASAFDHDPQGFVRAMAAGMSASDRALLQDPEIRASVIGELREAYRQGSDGHVVDSALAMTSGEWGFDLGDVRLPVFMWHGEEDRLVSKVMAGYLARALPMCTSYVVAGAGHLLLDDPGVIAQVREVVSR